MSSQIEFSILGSFGYNGYIINLFAILAAHQRIVL